MMLDAIGLFPLSSIFTGVLSLTAKETNMIPIELGAMAGGAAMGHLFKMMSAAQEAKAAQEKIKLEGMRGKQEVEAADRVSASASADAAAARAADPFTKLTRRIFVLSVVVMVFMYLMAPIFGVPISVPVEVEKGFNFLGLIDTTKTVTEYVTLNGMVSFREIWITFISAGSFYLGKS
jgi:hypothetical protein